MSQGYLMYNSTITHRETLPTVQSNTHCQFCVWLRYVLFAIQSTAFDWHSIKKATLVHFIFQFKRVTLLQTINYWMRWNNLKRFTSPCPCICCTSVRESWSPADTNSWQRNVILFCQQIWSIELIDDYSKKKIVRTAHIDWSFGVAWISYAHLSSAPSITTNFLSYQVSIYKTNYAFSSFIGHKTRRWNSKTFFYFDQWPPARECRIFTFFVFRNNRKLFSILKVHSQKSNDFAN